MRHAGREDDEAMMRTIDKVVMRVGGVAMPVIGALCLAFALLAMGGLVSENGWGWYLLAVLLCVIVTVLGWFGAVGTMGRWFGRLGAWGQGVGGEKQRDKEE